MKAAASVKKSSTEVFDPFYTTKGARNWTRIVGGATRCDPARGHD